MMIDCCSSADSSGSHWLRINVHVTLFVETILMKNFLVLYKKLGFDFRCMLRALQLAAGKFEQTARLFSDELTYNFRREEKRLPGERSSAEELLTPQTFSIMPVASSQIGLSAAAELQSRCSIAWLLSNCMGLGKSSPQARDKFVCHYQLCPS